MKRKARTYFSVILPRVVLSALGIFPALLGSEAATHLARVTTDAPTTEAAGCANQARSESGIAGQVSIRPVRPHETIGTPNLAPYQAKFEVVDSSGRPVTSFETDPSGNFRIALPPGKYILRPQSFGPYPRASEQIVVVSPNKFTQLRVVYDSGIR